MVIKRKKDAGKLGKWILLSIVAVYLVFTFTKQHFQLKDLDQEITSLHQQIEEQTELKQALSEQLNEQDALERVEKVARDELGFLKSDEIVFVDASADK